MESKHKNLVQNSMANLNILVLFTKNFFKMLKIGPKVVNKIAQIFIINSSTLNLKSTVFLWIVECIVVMHLFSFRTVLEHYSMLLIET